MEFFEAVCRDLGIRIAQDKTTGPGILLRILGVELNSVSPNVNAAYYFLF